MKTSAYNLFPMIGLRSAIPSPAENVTYDQNDAYDVAIVSVGFEKGSHNPTVVETIPFVNCKSLFDSPEHNVEFGRGKHDD